MGQCRGIVITRRSCDCAGTSNFPFFPFWTIGRPACDILHVNIIILSAYHFPRDSHYSTPTMHQNICSWTDARGDDEDAAAAVRSSLLTHSAGRMAPPFPPAGNAASPLAIAAEQSCSENATILASDRFPSPGARADKGPEVTGRYRDNRLIRQPVLCTLYAALVCPFVT